MRDEGKNAALGSCLAAAATRRLFMKYAIVIPDGCADEPQESLGGKTPLEAAHIPAMDAVAAAGIVGRANVGKSSLFNRLLGRDEAIVTDVAGTTRDLLEAELSLDGAELLLVDTAGEKIPAEDPNHQYLTIILDEVHRLEEIVNEILWYASPMMPSRVVIRSSVLLHRQPRITNKTESESSVATIA